MIEKNSTPDDKKNATVEFYSHVFPVLDMGEYEIQATQIVNIKENDKNSVHHFETNRRFVISSERFSLQAEEISSIYPPDFGEGNFANTFASVTFNRATLPWERHLKPGQKSLPWLAILVFDASSAPSVSLKKIEHLIPENITFKTLETGVSQSGKMGNHYISYPNIVIKHADMHVLEYGETPDMECDVIDVSFEQFKSVAPSLNDMKYLAHVRKVNLTNIAGMNNDENNSGNNRSTYEFSNLISNRIISETESNRAFLVSLEGMWEYLDNAEKYDYEPNRKKSIRLICYKSWSFSHKVNQTVEDFENTLQNLNRPSDQSKKSKQTELSTLQFPFDDDPPDARIVQEVLSRNGKLSDTVDYHGKKIRGSKILTLNSLGLGYVPFNHEMRAGNISVSWYRGPCVPQNIPYEAKKYDEISTVDSLNYFNPKTGMFDVSYAAAWQLGQLLALNDKLYSSDLLNLKNTINQAISDQRSEQAYNAGNQRTNLNNNQIISNHLALMPDDSTINRMIYRLLILYDVPFNYLVPYEDMLPPESIRIFYLDKNWINSLIHGAFSLHRAQSIQNQIDAILVEILKDNAGSNNVEINDASKVYTGFLLRSKVLSDWPNLNINAYGREKKLTSLRLDKLSNDLIIGIFSGDLDKISFSKPTDQVPCGINENKTITIRYLSGSKTGQQMSPIKTAAVSLEDGRVLFDKTVDAIKDQLEPRIGRDLTSAEFALEIITGSGRVDFIVDKNQHNR